MRDGRAYLNFLSDFWISLWTDTKTFSAFIGAGVEVLNRLYLQSVAVAAPDFIDKMPLFREDFWHLVYFSEQDKVAERTYRLPVEYHEIPWLYDKVFDPGLLLKAGRDFVLQQSDGATYIHFPKVDPFKEPRMPIRDLGNQKQILFFAPKVYVDQADLYELFGYLTGIVRPSSEQYRQLVKGVMFIYAHGPILFPLNAGLSLAAGYPVSREFDRVTGISNDQDHYLIATEKSHVYKVPLVATLSVEVGSELRPLSTFIDDIRIMDWMTDPEWWKGGPGETDPARRVVNFLSPELVPEMNEVLRDEPEVIDYLFEEYLKYNVLGLKLNTLALGNFNAIEEFFRVLYEVKPHYTAPYTNAYFRINEVWELPQELVEIAETIELTRALRPDDQGDASDRWYFPINIKLNGNLTIGFTRDNLKVLEETAHDRPILHASIEPIERNMVDGGRRIMNSKLVVGSYPDGGIMEKITMSAQHELEETYELGSDRVQLVVEEVDEGGVVVATTTVGDALYAG